MGQPDLYSFVLPRMVVAKLHFIHLLVTAAGEPSPKEKTAAAACVAPRNLASEKARS